MHTGEGDGAIRLGWASEGAFRGLAARKAAMESAPSRWLEHGVRCISRFCGQRPKDGASARPLLELLLMTRRRARKQHENEKTLGMRRGKN